MRMHKVLPQYFPVGTGPSVLNGTRINNSLSLTMKSVYDILKMYVLSTFSTLSEGSDRVDVDELIRVVSDAVKKHEESKPGSIIYRDEPIIRTARQLTNYVPDQIRKMRDITADDMSYRQELPCLFYRQGKFMENY